MQQSMEELIQKYVLGVQEIYGTHLRQVILYGSYARGDYNSDVDIMILPDLSDMEIKKYRHSLSDMTFDFNMDYDVDIKPIAKSEEHYNKWVVNYPFYANVNREGVKIYATA